MLVSLNGRPVSTVTEHQRPADPFILEKGLAALRLQHNVCAEAPAIEIFDSGLATDARNRGRTVFMSSHVLPEVERVCDRIAMLRKGEVVLLSSVADARKLASRRVRVAFQQDVAVPASLPQGYEMIDAKPRTWILSVTGQLGSLPSFLAALPFTRRCDRSLSVANNSPGIQPS